MATNARLVWAMARDRRLPGHQLLSRVPKATGGPTWATVLAAVAPAVPLIAVRSNTDALIDMFTAGTLMTSITPHSGLTPYARFGNGPAVALAALMAALALRRRRR